MVRTLAERHKVDKRPRTFSPWSHVVRGLLKLAGIAGKRFQAGIIFYDGKSYTYHPQRDGYPRCAYFQTLGTLSHAELYFRR